MVSILSAEAGTQAEPGWTPGLLIGTIATLVGAVGVALWVFKPSLRLAGIVAVVVAVATLAAIACATRPAVRGALASGGWSRLGALALSAVTTLSAAASVLLGAAFFIGQSPDYAWRYGPEVALTVGDDCTFSYNNRINRSGRTECDATWMIGGQTRHGTVTYRLNVPFPNRPIPAHVHDAGSGTAYTATTLTGPERSDDSSLVLGSLPSTPLVPALVGTLLGSVVLRRWNKRVARAAAARATAARKRGQRYRT
jgi:hypothetical protein